MTKPKQIMNKKVFLLSILQNYLIYAIFVVLLIAFAIVTNGTVISLGNLTNMLVYTTPIALIAMGVTIIIITTGIDLSSGATLALTAVATAKIAQVSVSGLTGLPLIIPIFVGLIIGGICGLINGVLITKTHIPPFIATLGMYTSARGLALVISEGRSISDLNPAFKELGSGTFLGIPMPILILVIMIALSHILLSSTKMGRYAYAIGGNKRAAQVSGINTDKYLIMIYTYAGILTAVAALITVGLLNSAQPILGQLYELDAIASSVIGGTSLSGGIGNIPGAIIGALFIGLLKNGMDLMYISAYWQQIVRGFVIVLAVVIDVQKQKLKTKTS